MVFDSTGRLLFIDAPELQPVEELNGCSAVGLAGVPVPDVDREELNESSGGSGAGVADDGRARHPN